MNDFNSAWPKELDKLFDPDGEYYPFLKAIFDTLPYSFMITDNNAVIRLANSYYYFQSGKDPATADYTGSKVAQYVYSGPAVIPQVCEDGLPRYGVIKTYEDGIPYASDFVPFYISGKSVGVIGYGQTYRQRELYLKMLQIKEANQNLKKEIGSAYAAWYTFADYWGSSEAVLALKQVGRKIARADFDVLIVGESGTGKEIFAQAIHNASPRAEQRFVSVNCATLDSSLISSELFGYEEGSFTGAKRGGSKGLFETADGGTIFLDEIAELNASMQAKLLRVLQERTIRRVGGTEQIPVNVRIIAATNNNLEQKVRQGQFRADLYYRLNVLSVELPPLRQRKEDIRILAEKFVESYSIDQINSYTLSDDAIAVLEQYVWPGNVRELKGAIQYAVTMSETRVLSPSDFPVWISASAHPRNLETHAEEEEEETLEACEQRMIRKMLKKYGTSGEAKKLIAQKLGISLSGLYVRLKKMAEE